MNDLEFEAPLTAELHARTKTAHMVRYFRRETPTFTLEPPDGHANVDRWCFTRNANPSAAGCCSIIRWPATPSSAP